MKRIISILIAAIIMLPCIQGFADDTGKRQILLCYDSNGALVYSNLLKDDVKSDIPQEYSDTTKKIYNVSTQEFSKFEDENNAAINTEIDKPEGVATEGTYIDKLMANLPKDRNSVISPLSLKMAMMMLANGATGETQKEILDVFGERNLREYNEYAAKMVEQDTAEYEEDFEEEFVSEELRIANSIWFNKDYYKNYDASFSGRFTEIITEYYKGAVKTVTNDTYADKVNSWINEKTYGKIPDIMQDGDGENKLLSLISTIYLRAKWMGEFDEQKTKKDIFTDINNKKTEIDFMNNEGLLYCYEDDNTSMVKLTYQNGLAMWIVLGDDTDFFNQKEKAELKSVVLSIPKFKIEYSDDYADIMQSMGVKKAFTADNKDFAGMVKNVPENLSIGSIMQKAIIDVDEKGTEAAAVTELGLAGGVYKSNGKMVFKADEPFTYYITNYYDDVLFAGRYVKPE